MVVSSAGESFMNIRELRTELCDLLIFSFRNVIFCLLIKRNVISYQKKLSSKLFNVPRNPHGYYFKVLIKHAIKKFGYAKFRRFLFLLGHNVTNAVVFPIKENESKSFACSKNIAFKFELGALPRINNPQ